MKNKDTETEEGVTIAFHTLESDTEANREKIREKIDEAYDILFDEMIRQETKNTDDTDDIILPKK